MHETHNRTGKPPEQLLTSLSIFEEKTTREQRAMIRREDTRFLRWETHPSLPLRSGKVLLGRCRILPASSKSDVDFYYIYNLKNQKYPAMVPVPDHMVTSCSPSHQRGHSFGLFMGCRRYLKVIEKCKGAFDDILDFDAGVRFHLPTYCFR